MSFLITSAKITGNPSTSGWAQVHDFTPQDPEKREKRGFLVAVIGTQKLDSLDTVTFGREILARLHEEYFGDTSKTAYFALKDAIEKIKNEFEEVSDNLGIAAISVVNDVIFASAIGGGKISLFRGGMLANILISLPFKGVSASGYPKDGDVLVVGTNSFFRIVSEGSLKAALTNMSLQAGVELLAPIIHSTPDSGDVAAVFIKFKKENSIVEKTSDGQVVPESEQKPKLKLSVFGDLFEKIKKRLPEKKLYVHGTENELENVKKKKITLLVGILILTLLLLSIFFGITERTRRQKESRFETKFSQAMHNFEEAMSLYSLNPERSRELFSQSQNLVDELSAEGTSNPALSDFKKRLQENEGKILGVYKVTPELFVDLSLLSDSFQGDKISAENNDLVILDKNGAKVVFVSIPTKTSEVRAGPSLVKNAEDLSLYSDYIYLLKADGVYDISNGNKRVIDKTWDGEVFIHAYAGNIYILEKTNGGIGRYVAGTQGFVSKKEWLSPGIEPDLSDIVDWVIDGSVWLLDKNGDVFKYSLGNPQPFSISGVSPPFLESAAIYTNEELKYLYILDPRNSRVVVLTKEGDFLAQYMDDKIGKTKDFAVSEKEKKIIILTGGELLSIDIKHL